MTPRSKPRTDAQLAADRRRYEATATKPPTPKQWAVLDYLYRTSARQLYQPSLAEIGQATGMGLTSVKVCLLGLARRGYVGDGEPRSKRSVRILKTPTGEPFRGFEAGDN